MRKRFFWLSSVVLVVSMLTGCGKAPESAVVRQKDREVKLSYEEAASRDELLRAAIGAPEHYAKEMIDPSGELSILMDAEVDVPDVKDVGVIAVSKHTLTDQAELDRITEALFPDAKIYEYYTYRQQTKADLKAKIEELKSYAAAGNLDPYGRGTYENGDYVYDIYDAIEQAEQEYEIAPETRTVPEKLSPHVSGFTAAVEMVDGTLYKYESIGAAPMAMWLQVTRMASGEDGVAAKEPTWTDYQRIRDDRRLQSCPSQQEMAGSVRISIEEAKRMAEGWITALGLPDMELFSWGYAIRSTSSDWPSQVDIRIGGENSGGYVLHYTRSVGGVPITYTSQQCSAFEAESMDDEMMPMPWGYEDLTFYVSEEGIGQMMFCNQYDMGETQARNVALMPFSEIATIYENMMAVRNADSVGQGSEIKAQTYRIHRITLGYSRIYEPSSAGESGILIPVWDFFGDVECATQEGGYVDEGGDYSYLTINAVDGSVIERELGY